MFELYNQTLSTTTTIVHRFRYKKGPVNLRCPNIELPKLDRYWAEQIIAFMLLEKYLKEDFHFTAYNTISYIRKGPKVPKRDDDILFHGARVLKLPEYDAVWNGNTTQEDVAESSRTPKSAKRRKNSSTAKEGSAKRSKTKSPGSSSASSSKNRNSSSTSSVTTPKRSSISDRSSSVAPSPQVAATSKKGSKSVTSSGSAAVNKLVRETDTKSTRLEAPTATDDVIYIPEDQNVIEILD